MIFCLLSDLKRAKFIAKTILQSWGIGKGPGLQRHDKRWTWSNGGWTGSYQKVAKQQRRRLEGPSKGESPNSLSRRIVCLHLSWCFLPLLTSYEPILGSSNYSHGVSETVFGFHPTQRNKWWWKSRQNVRNEIWHKQEFEGGKSCQIIALLNVNTAIWQVFE